MSDAQREFDRTIRTILAEARAQVAAGRGPDVAAFEERLRHAGAGADAIERLRAIASVHRARAAVVRKVEPAAAPAAARPPSPRTPLRTKPTVTGSLGVRRADGDGFRLAWDRVAAVTEWEVRFSERPDVRSDYVERETLVLEGGATSVELPLGERPFRVTVLGRGRGKLQRRALVSGLTRENWRERWQRRATAS